MAASSDFLQKSIDRFARQQLHRMCYGKMRYTTQERAERAGRAVHDEHGFPLMTSYLCTHCQYWHLTKVFSQKRMVYAWLKFYAEGRHEGD